MCCVQNWKDRITKTTCNANVVQLLSTKYGGIVELLTKVATFAGTVGGRAVGHRDVVAVHLGWKFISCSQSQELCQLADLASDWLFILKQPIRSRISSLTQLLTLTTSQKFPPRGWLNSRSMGFPLSLSRSLLLGYLKAKFET